jgi:hypothetical protein
MHDQRRPLPAPQEPLDTVRVRLSRGQYQVQVREPGWLWWRWRTVWTGANFDDAETVARDFVDD